MKYYRTVFTCSVCYHEISITDNSVGYATTNNKNKKICYECCAEKEKEFMRNKGKITLYLSSDQIVNWPGTLRFRILRSKKSKQNFGRTRTDVWFRFESNIWHGYQIGDRNDLCHCRKTKRSSIW